MKVVWICVIQSISFEYVLDLKDKAYVPIGLVMLVKLLKLAFVLGLLICRIFLNSIMDCQFLLDHHILHVKNVSVETMPVFTKIGQVALKLKTKKKMSRKLQYCGKYELIYIKKQSFCCFSFLSVIMFSILH